MISMTTIQQAIAKVLKENTGYRVYKSDVIEKYIAPCFFVDTNLDEVSPANINSVRCELTVSIYYFAKLDNMARVRDEIDNETMITKLYEMFGLNFPVGERVFSTKGLEYSFTGESGDIPKFSFNVTYFDSLKKQEESGESTDYIDKIDIATTLKENEVI